MALKEARKVKKVKKGKKVTKAKKGKKARKKAKEIGIMEMISMSIVEEVNKANKVKKEGRYNNYKDLIVWKKSHLLALKIFKITKDFSKQYMFDLTNQLRRASLSIPTNIVEGNSSVYTKEFLQFLNISYRSVSEVKYLLQFSFEEGILKEEIFIELIKGYEEIEKMLGALMSSLRKNIVKKKSFSTLFTLVTFFTFSTLVTFFTSFTSFASTGKGGQPGAFLSWGAGARALGMGKAYVSVVEDATATLWNPGGLALVDQKEVTALHAILWADTNYDYLSYVNPTLDYGTFGLSILYLDSGGFEGTDLENKFTGTFSDTQFAVGASYGTNLISSFALSLGGNIKYYSHSIAGKTSGNVILDFGVISKPFTNFKAGLSIQNLVNLKTGEETDDVLPILARIGLSYQLLNEQLLFSGDFDSQVNWYLGSEYKLFNPSLGRPFQIAIRMGVNYEEFTVGFGASYKEYGLDYAFSTHELGSSHRFSASARFGESMQCAREAAKKSEEVVKLEEANSNYKRAIEEYKQGTYKSAIEKITRSLELSPENPDSQRLFKKLKVVAPVFPMITDTGVESELTRKAINYYIDGDVQTAIDIFSYLLYKQPENDKLRGLYKTIGEEIGVVVTPPSGAGINPVQAKLLEALGSFYEGKFTNVIKLCSEVLRFEPGNITALERLGSAYYKLNQKAEAKECWQKALMLNPENKILKKFIDKLEKEIQQIEAPAEQVK